MPEWLQLMEMLIGLIEWVFAFAAGMYGVNRGAAALEHRRRPDGPGIPRIQT